MFWSKNYDDDDGLLPVQRKYDLKGLTEKELNEAQIVYKNTAVDNEMCISNHDYMIASFVRQNWIIISILGRIADAVIKDKDKD